MTELASIVVECTYHERASSEDQTCSLESSEALPWLSNYSVGGENALHGIIELRQLRLMSKCSFGLKQALNI